MLCVRNQSCRVYAVVFNDNHGYCFELIVRFFYAAPQGHIGENLHCVRYDLSIWNLGRSKVRANASGFW